ncbi:MAG: hypothetical protein N3A69_18595, partial [Leptospiraceae bacterium]|nr:hypothetical protein [Leptospiraceae bacterium]
FYMEFTLYAMLIAFYPEWLNPFFNIFPEEYIKEKQEAFLKKWEQEEIYEIPLIIHATEFIFLIAATLFHAALAVLLSPILLASIAVEIIKK